MENWPALHDLPSLWTQAAAWVNANLLSGGLAPQVISIAGAFLAARLLVLKLGPRLTGALARLAEHRGRALGRLRPVVLPGVWLLLQWFSLVALRESEVPRGAVAAVVSLLAAWVGVRIALSWIASPFLSRAIAVTVVVAAALKVFGLWEVTLHLLDEMAITIGAVRLSVLRILEAGLILFVLCWAAFAAARRLDRWAERLPGVTPSGRILLGKAFRICALLVAFILALDAIGVDFAALAVFSGAAGITLGFGLQKSVGNLVSGIMLLLDGSIKPGDVVVVGEHYGWINALGARCVSVVTRDRIEYLIPNEDLVTSRVENWSHSDNLLRLHLPIGISYRADPHRAIELVEQAARETPRVLREPEPRCLAVAFGESTIDLDARFWINDPRNGVHNVKSAVLLRIWDLYHQHGIELPYPQRDLHLKTAVAVPVRVVRGIDGDGDEAGPGPTPDHGGAATARQAGPRSSA